MKKGRMILHSDLNSFYASVEIMQQPQLKGQAVAVCGSADDRHGIVLAKSEKAKKAGIKTGMANWQAKRLCPELIMVAPRFHEYVKYSRAVREIYSRFSKKIEPYGMDECWIDISPICSNFQQGEEIANQIRELTKSELGLSVSIGVSFNKIFAKLGSDLKKPDAVTVITEENFRKKIWPLPASELLFVGRSTTQKLQAVNVHTIGQLANTDPGQLRKLLGINGVQLWTFANGKDTGEVMELDFKSQIKSVGHGITCRGDLESSREVWRVMLQLSQDIGEKLRSQGLMATGVQITVRDNELNVKQYQTGLGFPSQSAMEIAYLAKKLFESNYDWHLPIRSVTVRAINLFPAESPLQLDLLDDFQKRQRQHTLETTIDTLRGRFGDRSITFASLMGDLKMPLHSSSIILMPGMQDEIPLF